MIQNALNTLLANAPFAGTGGSVQVTPLTPTGFGHHGFSPPSFEVTFVSGLSQTTIPLMTTDWPPPVVSASRSSTCPKRFAVAL